MLHEPLCIRRPSTKGKLLKIRETTGLFADIPLAIANNRADKVACDGSGMIARQIHAVLYQLHPGAGSSLPVLAGYTIVLLVFRFPLAAEAIDLLRRSCHSGEHSAAAGQHPGTSVERRSATP